MKGMKTCIACGRTGHWQFGFTLKASKYGSWFNAGGTLCGSCARKIYPILSTTHCSIQARCESIRAERKEE